MSFKRVKLYRWNRHRQVDIRTPRGFLSLGWTWRYQSRPVLYWSPDATPTHPAAWGLWRGLVG